MKKRIKLLLIILLVLGLMFVSLIRKRIKPVLIILLALGLLLVPLSGCGCDGGGNVGLVFVNDSDAAIVTVVAEFADRSSGAQNADYSPLKRGDSLGFEAGEYPVTVLVYNRPVGPGPAAERELARIVIHEAPKPGERWYVTARDGMGGLKLAAEPCWPGGV